MPSSPTSREQTCLFPKADAGGRESTNLSKKTEGVEVPMEEFLQFTKIPIIIYYGDNLPETDERPELYEWTRRCI